MSNPYSHSHPLERYSTKKTVKPVSFICLATEAKEVTLVGDFNDWHPHAHPMKRAVDGAWHLQVPLGAGHHHYQFLVDGKPTLDPRASGIGRNEENEKVSLIAVS